MFVSLMSCDIFMESSTSDIMKLKSIIQESGTKQDAYFLSVVSSCQCYTLVQFPAVWFMLTEQTDYLV